LGTNYPNYSFRFIEIPVAREFVPRVLFKIPLILKDLIGLHSPQINIFFSAPPSLALLTLREAKRKNPEDVEAIVTDDLNVYPPAIAKTEIDPKKHKTINHSGGVYVMGEIHTNTVESAFSLLKRGIIGTWHKISAKHLQAYLDEMTFRFNRRGDDATPFKDTMRQLLNTPNVTFQKRTV